MTRRTTCVLVAMLLSLALSACGFHLREALTLPPELDGVQVVARNPYSPLAQSLTRSLVRAGFDVPERRGPGVAVLRILSERWDSQAISVDQFGRAQEYSLRYASVFRLDGIDGEELVPEQVIELSREYISLPENSTGSESEREMLSRELEREMAAAVLRRIASVTRAREQAQGGQPGELPEPESAPDPDQDDGLDQDGIAPTPVGG